MGTELWVWAFGAVYAAGVVLVLWFAHRAYRQSNGYDMDTEHQAIMTVLALLWPITAPLALIAILAAIFLRSGR